MNKAQVTKDERDGGTSYVSFGGNRKFPGHIFVETSGLYHIIFRYSFSQADCIYKASNQTINCTAAPLRLQVGSIEPFFFFLFFFFFF